jgi:uncharacterized membrane protein YkgB
MEHQLLICAEQPREGCPSNLASALATRPGFFAARSFLLQREGRSMSFVTKILVKLGILKDGLDYHLARSSMVIIFLLFGYSKWFDYEAQRLISYISHGPLISWMYPVFGIRGASRFLGVSEWSFAALLFAGFWNKKLGILGAIGSCFSFLATLTIIPFLPNAWATSAGGFPAMTDSVAFLMKDLALFAVSVYLLRQDVLRVSLSAKESFPAVGAQLQHN